MHDIIYLQHHEYHVLIHQLEKLRNGWDGYNALAPDKQVIKNTKEILTHIGENVLLTDIVPNCNGTVSLMTESNHGNSHLEIDVNNFSFYITLNCKSALKLDGPCTLQFVEYAIIALSDLLFPELKIPKIDFTKRRNRFSMKTLSRNIKFETV